MHFQTPSAIEVGEITVQDLRRQNSEQDLTRSNWRFFHAMQQKSPAPGSGRRDENSQTSR